MILSRSAALGTAALMPVEHVRFWLNRLAGEISLLASGLVQGGGWAWRPVPMGRAYSFDLRERVAEAVAEGESCRAAAARFAVGVSTVVRWSQRARETGSPAALPVGGHRPLKPAVQAGGQGWLGAGAADGEARHHAAGCQDANISTVPRRPAGA